jgi:hypothetical protein
VPYTGAGPALVAAMANDVQVLFDPLATGKKYAERKAACARVRAANAPSFGLKCAPGGVDSIDSL